MREREEEMMQSQNIISASENEEPLSTSNMNLQTAIAIIMDEVAADCPIEELMSVVADVAMKYHDGDSAFFFNYDKGMKTAQCTYETHRANFPPICGTEPLYLDEYPILLTMMVDVLTKIAATRNKKWEYSNVYDILKRLDYTGAVVGQKKNWKGIDNARTTVRDKSEWIIVPNCHEALVSENDYNKAQAVIKKVTHYGRSNQDYPLRSLVRCGVCGRVMERNNRCKRIY